MQKSKGRRFALTVNRRLFLFFIACCIQMIYIPTSNRVSGGIEPKLAIDVFPIWPIWVLPYVLCYILWLISIGGIIFKSEDRDFRAFIAACMLTFALGVSIFTFFPTYVKSTPIMGNDCGPFTEIGDDTMPSRAGMFTLQRYWPCSSAAGIRATNLYGFSFWSWSHFPHCLQDSITF
jgi:hypothetical protein